MTNSKKINKINKKSDKNDNLLYGDLQPIQITALNWCSKKARIYHKNVYDNVMIRFLDLGFTMNCLDAVIEYIKNIDPIIHFGRRSLSPVDWLRTEKNIKNAFEVYNSSFPVKALWEVNRIKWENNLFNQIYDTECQFNLRVKYGCLNLMNDKAGCGSAAPMYGKSYMILKSEVKKRITFCCGDSASMEPHICTFDHYIQLLLYLSIPTLKDLVIMANFTKNKDKNTDEPILNPVINNIYRYVEIQIHGDVILSRDIAHIMLFRPHTSPEILHRLNQGKISYTIFD